MMRVHPPISIGGHPRKKTNRGSEGGMSEDYDDDCDEQEDEWEEEEEKL